MKLLALILACTISVSGFVTSFANTSVRSNDSGGAGGVVVDSSPPPNFMMSRAAFTITSEAQLAAVFPDPAFRKAVFAKVKGCAGANLKAALASFDGTIRADNKGISDIHGLELLTHAEKVSLKKNNIKDFSFLNMGANHYGITASGAVEGKNVEWDFGGNPFEKLPENFGGNLVIAQAGTTAYVYPTEPLRNRVFLRDRANDSFDGILQIGKCTVGEGKKNVKVISVDANHKPSEKTLFTVTKHTNTTADITGIRTSGEQKVAVGVDEELHYHTTDELGTVTPGSQSFKYYISPKVLVYDRITLTHNDPKGEVTITKTDDTPQKKPLPGAVYTLYSKSTDKPFKERLITDVNGKCTVDKLPAGEYYFRETKAPQGYKLDPKPVDVTIGTDRIELTGGEHEITVTASGKTETAKHNEAFLAGSESADIAFDLVAGNVGKVVVTYTSLDDVNGVSSLNIVKEFTALQEAQDDINTMKNANRITGAVDVKVTFTGNSPVVKREVTQTNALATKIDIPVEKIWNDNGDVYGMRPQSVEISLLRNGALMVPEKKLVLSEANDWKGTFEGLSVNDGEGGIHTYIVEEKPVENYTNVVVQDPHSDLWTITNTVEKPASFDINGTKKWLGDTEAERPRGASFKLLQNGKPLWGAYANKASNSQFKFWDLPINDKNGVPYKYEIQEDAVKGYESVANYVVTTPNTPPNAPIPVTITNVRKHGESVDPPKPDPTDPDNPTPPEFEINGTKIWVGDIATDRPARVAIELWQNGGILYKDYATAESDWTFHFWALPLKDDAGKAYKYEIKEEAVTGYSSRITPVNGTENSISTVTVTNTKNKQGGGNSDEPSPSPYPPEDITVEYEEPPKPPEPLVPPAPPVKNPDTGRIFSLDIMRGIGVLKWI